MRLDHYSTRGFDRGRQGWVEGLWILLQMLFVSSSVPGSWHRVQLLRLFGARIGEGVVIKARVTVKFPWRLQVGAWSWLGEAVWIDNLAEVRIGNNAVISQGAYICTGSHDWRLETFDLVVKPIEIGDSAWICAGSMVAPGTNVGPGALLTMGSVATGQLQTGLIYRGNPAVAAGLRHETNATNADERDGATSSG